MSDDDLWDCFGGQDSESDEDTAEDINQKETRLHLINKANSRSQIVNTSSEKSNSDILIGGTSQSSMEGHDDVKTPPAVEMWGHRPPLYMGPMAVIETTNCKRGYIATEDLNPGTLLLVEEPVFKWPEEQIGSELGMLSVQAIMEHEFAQAIVHDIESLYPTRLDVDRVCRKNDGENLIELAAESNEKIQVRDMVEIMQMQHSGGRELEKVMDEAKRKKITCSDQNSSLKAVDEIDVMRMLLALRYNGFDSGLYLHFAMFNHDDDANCVKYLPENEYSKLNEGKTKIYSEIRTTKFVRKGSALTLHYLNPREMSHATRRSHIYEQHRFDIGTKMEEHSLELQEMELVNGKFPVSLKDRKDPVTATSLIENAINDLDTLHKELEIASASSILVDQEIDDTMVELFERCKALEMATHELIQAAQTKLDNKKHILLIRCCRLHLDSSELLLHFGKGGKTSFSLTSNQQSLIWCRFIQTCQTLLPIQIQYLGEHHPDIARTYYDFAIGINLLLSRSPKKLFNIGLPDLGSFDSCQRFEAKCRREHLRIDSL
eukprot:CAMPEP_0203681540 /NCGR_PEP_ID=MMETSP0090-20130426/43023_1 /ASSEMBLY_ACC=CAM_ASM_001088 /TAXON_ID=426623 /ORGANISM="Chaetoceros affinis, Strain CCMP159" /LENGTH=546 /DNA_ID=CAMNT_0050550055 /DNA_START=80 /DNA_END=1717 /DNA_ORIENTATION=-